MLGGEDSFVGLDCAVAGDGGGDDLSRAFFQSAYWEVSRHLIAAGHEVHVVTGAPDFVFTSEIQSANLHIRKSCSRCWDSLCLCYKLQFKASGNKSKSDGQWDFILNESTNLHQMAMSTTKVAFLEILTLDSKDLLNVNISYQQKRGDFLMAIGSPFGVLSPSHFLNRDQKSALDS